MFPSPFLRLSLLLLLVPLALCKKVSPKFGLKSFREDYKSITETCQAVGFVRKCGTFTSKGKPVVAFDVRLKDHKRSLGKGSKVVFETVDFNEGRGYDASSGVFTAPYGGIYVFDWTTLAWKGKYAYTSLVVNGSNKSWNHCHDIISKTWLPCSKMAVAKLKQGDKAWIGVFSGTADMYQQYTSFSGFKL